MTESAFSLASLWQLSGAKSCSTEMFVKLKTSEPKVVTLLCAERNHHIVPPRCHISFNPNSASRLTLAPFLLLSETFLFCSGKMTGKFCNDISDRLWQWKFYVLTLHSPLSNTWGRALYVLLFVAPECLWKSCRNVPISRTQSID